MTIPLLDSIEDVFRGIKRPLLLYSGGVDSKFFLLLAQERGVPVVALHVHLGPGEADPAVGELARNLGADYRLEDLTDPFVSGFVAPAIKANASYEGQYPVCSSLSRPLMVEAAVRLASEEGLDGIIHTAGYFQNSSWRFNRSIRTLAPWLAIGNPFLRDTVSRAEKVDRLERDGVGHPLGVFSVDENVWGRVVENGVLDDPGHPVPEGVFVRTANPVDAPPSPPRSDPDAASISGT